MAIFQAVIDFHASNRQQKEGAYKRPYVSIKKNEVSLPLGRGRSGRDKKRPTACRKPTAEVPMLRPYREEHIH